VVSYWGYRHIEEGHSQGLAGLTLGCVGSRPDLTGGPIVLAVGGLWATRLLVFGRHGTFAFAPPIMVGGPWISRVRLALCVVRSEE